MANRRQRRKGEKERRHAPKPAYDGELGGPVGRLVYSREQTAQALGISLATLDRHVVPAIATVKTEWGARLIPATEFDRYLAERTEQPLGRPRRSGRAGRKAKVPPDVVARVRDE